MRRIGLTTRVAYGSVWRKLADWERIAIARLRDVNELTEVTEEDQELLVELLFHLPDLYWEMQEESDWVPHMRRQVYIEAIARVAVIRSDLSAWHRSEAAYARMLSRILAAKVEDGISTQVVAYIFGTETFT